MNELLFEIPQAVKNVLKSKKGPSFPEKNIAKRHEEELKKTHHFHPQYHDTVKNSGKYIKELSRKSFDELGKNLDVIREQMEMAIKRKKYSTYELLYEWESQYIEARILKFIEEEKKIGKKKKE
ncbi:MAG: hypothetical protein HYY40_12555 [Bacteroidetes bacterium]|nr:hypothetical protein [Bacteroidota bacterium]